MKIVGKRSAFWSFLALLLIPQPSFCYIEKPWNQETLARVVDDLVREIIDLETRGIPVDIGERQASSDFKENHLMVTPNIESLAKFRQEILKMFPPGLMNPWSRSKTTHLRNALKGAADKWSTRRDLSLQMKMGDSYGGDYSVDLSNGYYVEDCEMFSDICRGNFIVPRFMIITGRLHAYLVDLSFLEPGRENIFGALALNDGNSSEDWRASYHGSDERIHGITQLKMGDNRYLFRTAWSFFPCIEKVDAHYMVCDREGNWYAFRSWSKTGDIGVKFDHRHTERGFNYFWDFEYSQTPVGLDHPDLQKDMGTISLKSALPNTGTLDEAGLASN